MVSLNYTTKAVAEREYGAVRNSAAQQGEKSMIVTKKVHRGASVIAAIVMLLMALISVASSAISMITGSASASAVVFNLIIPLIFNTLTI